MAMKWIVPWTVALAAAAGCSTRPPSAPSDPVAPRVSLTFTLANPAQLSVSEPMPCPGDWLTCPRGRQAQGAPSTQATILKTHRLSPGTYRVTGVLRPTTMIGASVSIRLALDREDGSATGVVREAPQVGAVAHVGELTANPSLVPLVCGAIVFNPSGELEWSLTFRVVETALSFGQVCAETPGAGVRGDSGAT